jgi:phage repressor protein C with HTH and peptisase S24 domain
MGRANFVIEKLQSGQPVQIRVTGNSMTGKISSGSTVRIEPIPPDATIAVGDIVLARVRGHEYLHLVSAIRGGDEYQISNNHGHVNGWAKRSAIYGRYVGTVKRR